jgi:hypothetical protein
MELQEFLNNVVGMGSVSKNEAGQWKIEPYEIIIEEESALRKSGYIAFKGIRFQNFLVSTRSDEFKTVQGMVESLNYGYATAIKDVVDKGNVDSVIKPFKFV